MVSDTRKPPRGDTTAPQEGSKPAPFGLLFGGLFLVAFFLAEYLRLKLKIESVGQRIEKLFHGSLCNGTQILLFYALNDGCACLLYTSKKPFAKLMPDRTICPLPFRS